MHVTPFSLRSVGPEPIAIGWKFLFGPQAAFPPHHLLFWPHSLCAVWKALPMPRHHLSEFYAADWLLI